MKRLARFGLIGAMHATCYLWLIPRVILPRFGSTGAKVAVVCVVLISLGIATTLLPRPKK